MEEALLDSFPKGNQSNLQQEQQQQHQTQMTSQHLFLRSPSGQRAHLQAAPSRRAGAAAPSSLYVEHSPESTAFGSSLANSSDQSNLSESTSNRSPNPNFRGRVFPRPPACNLYSTQAFGPSMQITTVALNQDHNLSNAIEYSAASSNTHLMQNKHLLPASTEQSAPMTTTLSFENVFSARGVAGGGGPAAAAGRGGAGLSADINAPRTSNIKLRTSWTTGYEDKSTVSVGGLNLSPLVLIQGDEVIDHGSEVLRSHAATTLLQAGDMTFGPQAQTNIDNIYLHSSNNSTCTALADANIVQEADFVDTYNDQGLPEGLKVSLGQAQGGHMTGTGNLEEQYLLYDRLSGSVSTQLLTSSSGTSNRGGGGEGGGPATDRRHDQSYTNVVSRHHIQDQLVTWSCANNANSATTGSTELLLLPRIDNGGANGSHHAFSHTMTSSTTHAAAPPQVSSLHYNQSHAPQLLLAAAVGGTRHSNDNYSSCASGAGSGFLLPASSSMQQDVPNSDHHQYAWDKTPEMDLRKSFNINNAAQQHLNRHLQRTFNIEGDDKFASNLRQPAGDLSLFFSAPPDPTPQQHRPASLSPLDSRLSHSGSLGVLRSSRYLRAAQQLLDEFCSVGRGNTKNEEHQQPWPDPQHGITNKAAATLPSHHTFNKQPGNIDPSTGKPVLSAKATEDPQRHHDRHNHHDQASDPDHSAAATPRSAAGRSSSQQTAAAVQVDGLSSKQLPADERCHLQMKKARLIAMVEELDRRYRQYREQMQLVVTSFESAAGLGAAAPYTAMARRAMSRHFRGLRDAMGGHIRAACEALGEEVSSAAPILSRGETPRLRLLDQRLRHHRALQQIGLLQHQAWRPQRGLPERSVSVLRSWLFEHFLHPYPKDSDKLMLARLTGLTRNQVSNWFINARVRLWKPMVEEMYNEEKKELEREAAATSSTEVLLAKDHGSANAVDAPSDQISGGGGGGAFFQAGAGLRCEQISRSTCVLSEQGTTRSTSDKADVSGKHKVSFPASFPNNSYTVSHSSSIHQLLGDDDASRAHYIGRGQYYNQIDVQPDITALGGALTTFNDSYNQHNQNHRSYATDHDHQQLMRSQHALPTNVGNVQHGLNSNAILQNHSAGSFIKNGVTLTLGLQQSTADQPNGFHNHHIGDMQHLYDEPRHSDILRFS